MSNSTTCDHFIAVLQIPQISKHHTPVNQWHFNPRALVKIYMDCVVDALHMLASKRDCFDVVNIWMHI